VTLSPETLLAFAMPHDIAIRALLLGVALGLDAWLGEPDWLWRYLPHPVVLLGRAVSLMEKKLNRRGWRGGLRRGLGLVGMLGLILLAVATGTLIMALGGIGGRSLTLPVETLLVAILLAGRSLDDHVRAVAVALEGKNLAPARRAVAMIVGRNPDALDRHAIARASIETTAENLSDGVIAPALFYLVGGIPGILAYKMINTADSMIGYKSKRFLAFGWGAARLDDLANLIPARFTGLLIALVAPAHTWLALRVMWRDAGHHRSPNAGWPEAAMAAALGVALAGPRRYGMKMSTDQPMHAEGRRDANAGDILNGLNIMWRVIGLFGLAVLAAGYAMLNAG